MVGGLALGKNILEHRIKVFQDGLRSNAQRAESVVHQPDVAFLIPLRLRASIMKFAIDFDRQPHRKANKIKDKWAGGMLSPELQASRSLPKLPPEKPFG